MTAPTLPDRKEVLDLIRYDAFYAAIDAIKDMRLFETQGNTFVIGKNTRYETSFVRNQDGTFGLDTKSPYSRLRTYHPKASNIFNQTPGNT